MILRDENSDAFLERLDLAWRPGRPTFALLPRHFDKPDSWVSQALAALPDNLRAEHVVLATSGSTGDPKLLVANRSRAEAMASVIGHHQRVDDLSGVIISLPLSYCFALVNQWVLARCFGLSKRVAGFSAPAELVAELQRAEAAQLCLVGAQVPMLAQLGGQSFPGIRTVAFAGSPFPWGQSALLARIFPEARFYNNYGCAEAMPRLVVQDVTQDVRDREPRPAGWLGRPLPGINFRRSELGELTFQSPYAALGTLTPEGFAAFPAGGWIATGDIADCDNDGNWRLRGRNNEVFKRHGEKVSLLRLRTTIEGVCNEPYALCPAKDRAGETGVQLVLSGAADRSTARAILKAIRDAHPRAHWPLQILHVANMPLLSSGKIDQKALLAIDEKQILWDQRV